MQRLLQGGSRRVYLSHAVAIDFSLLPCNYYQPNMTFGLKVWWEQEQPTAMICTVMHTARAARPVVLPQCVVVRG